MRSSIDEDTYDKYYGLVPAIRNFPINKNIQRLKHPLWKDMIKTEEFLLLETMREQIVYSVNHLCCSSSPKRLTHQEVADYFGISRQALEEHYRKGTRGVLDPFRPSLFKDNEVNEIKKHILETFQFSQFFLVDEIMHFVNDKFHKNVKPDSMRHFLKEKCSDIGKMVIAIPLESCRFEVSLDKINSYYEKLGEILGTIDYRYCYNLDETGEDEFSDAQQIKVYVPADYPDDKASVPVKRGMKRFTIVHCISSGGRMMPLYYIIPRKTIPNDIWRVIDRKSAAFRSQPKGFMTESLFRDYFEKHFIPNLIAHRFTDDYWGPALLIMDNLLSHKKVVGAAPDQDLIFIPQYNLIVLFLVPHSSDQTQPLDIGIFGVHKALSQRINITDDYSEFTKKVLKATTSLEKASTTIGIVNAFAGAGIVRRIDSDETIHLTVDRARCTKVRNDYTVRKPVEWKFKNVKLQEF